ncbi:hypothetical protein WA158_003877 [Blastocystis sp. Blastoise]
MSVNNGYESIAQYSNNDVYEQDPIDDVLDDLTSVASEMEYGYESPTSENLIYSTTLIPLSTTTLNITQKDKKEKPKSQPERSSKVYKYRVKRCASCKKRQTPRWHVVQIPKEKLLLCNACAMRFKKYKSICQNCLHAYKKDELDMIICPKCKGHYPILKMNQFEETNDSELNNDIMSEIETPLSEKSPVSTF